MVIVIIVIVIIEIVIIIMFFLFKDFYFFYRITASRTPSFQFGVTGAFLQKKSSFIIVSQAAVILAFASHL